VEIEANRRSVKELFIGGDQLEVPPYQRPYSWTVDEVDQLWVDITEAGDEGYFLGPLVIYRDRELQKRVIIDGQQRLTTLQLILALIRDRYHQLGSPRKMNPASLIITAGYAEGDDLFRLRSGRANWEVLKNFVLRNPDDPTRLRLEEKKDRKQLSKRTWLRNKMLVAAYARLKGHLDKYLEGTAVETALQVLDERIATKIDLVAIEVAGLSDAFLLFETLNYRGLQLSAADLLKSHLLRRLDEKHHDDARVEAAAQEWDELVDSLGATDITRFLRHYLLSTHRKVRKSEIFELFQQETRNVGPEAMLSELRTMGSLYAQFLNPSLAEEMVRPVMTDIADTGVVTPYVALLPALRWLEAKQFIRFGRLSEVVAFRWSVCGKNAQELESLFQAAAETLAKSKGSEVAQAMALLEANVPADAEFFERYRVQTLGVMYVARYALRKIEEALRRRSELKLKSPEEVHVEHIMPVSPTQFWLQRVGSDDEYSGVISRWGNLTLLHKAPNQEIQNGPWDVKRTEYAKSHVMLTKSLTSREDWNSGEIEFRQAWMAQAAIGVWSLDAAAGKDFQIDPYEVVRAHPEAHGLGSLLFDEDRLDPAEAELTS
jgi:hypothetical protein